MTANANILRRGLAQAHQLIKRFRLAVLLSAVLLLSAGCDQFQFGTTAAVEYPTVNLPEALRQQNWQGRLDEGSCVHATLISLLRWQGRFAMADYWRTTYGDGEFPDTFNEKLAGEGIRFAFTAGEGDVEFLDWACRTRRGAGVTVLGGRHMVALVHLDRQWAGLLDNNNPAVILWVPRERFLAEWLNSNSWAFTPIYTPHPPLPDR